MNFLFSSNSLKNVHATTQGLMVRKETKLVICEGDDSCGTGVIHIADSRYLQPFRKGHKYRV